MTTTSLAPWPSSVQSYDVGAPGLADQVAMLLAEERQVVVAITGPEDGRMVGFLADLTHAVTQKSTVLRIKTALAPDELFHALAAQLGLETDGTNDIALAARVGRRLSETPNKGSYALLCEAAHTYPPGMLEAIRQLSNYPINIVLYARRQLFSRLGRAGNSGLSQRINYRLDLDGGSASPWLRTLAIAAGVAIVAYFAAQWLNTDTPAAIETLPSSPPADLPRPIITPAPAQTIPQSETPAITSTPTHAPSEAAAAEEGLPLVMERSLARPPKTAPSH